MKTKIIGRQDEITTLKALLKAQRNILLEGAVGVGKTALALHITEGHKFFRVDGDGRYSEAKLAGTFDPALVLSKGYKPDFFSPGPLTAAMQEGAILFINELNRMPEGVQNILIPALDERRIEIPHLGTVHAKPGFTVIATQNPAEFIGTSFLSEALRDRFELVTIDYQDRKEELGIMSSHVDGVPAEVSETIIDIVRISRNHPDLKSGASIRAAIGLATLLKSLNLFTEEALRKYAPIALITRVVFREDIEKTKNAVIDEIVTLALKKKPKPGS